MSEATERRALPPLRTANLTIWAEGAELRAHYKNNKTLERSKPALKLNIHLGMLGDKFLKIRDKLSDIATRGIWSELSDPLAPSPGVSYEIFKGFTETVVSEGAALYKQLISEPELGPYIKKINDLPPGSSISIETDCALLPWEILYPYEFNTGLPKGIKSGIKIVPEKMWGNRFIIEYFISPRNGSSGVPPVEEHESGRSFVSLNVNPTIDGLFEGLQYKPVKKHKSFFNSHLRRKKIGELNMNGEAIKRMLLSDTAANIIYLYCHGKSDDPYEKGGGEQLELDQDDVIEPAFFDYGSNKYLRGPIVILNSCSSGAYSPLSFSTFHAQLIKRRALGVIGTTLPMPATFACAFGQQMIQNYLKGDETIGEVLLRLRRELSAQNNPLGLFYVLQCPSHVKAPSS
ncbi:MAG TPA: hypothetical protein VF538_13515 [Pyrinomonadaceae bacterium]|jgi:hypothetical protein